MNATPKVPSVAPIEVVSSPHGSLGRGRIDSWCWDWIAGNGPLKRQWKWKWKSLRVCVSACLRVCVSACLR
eukprot:7345042-Alexandrium_andersonii.AAC.1